MISVGRLVGRSVGRAARMSHLRGGLELGVLARLDKLLHVGPHFLAAVQRLDVEHVKGKGKIRIRKHCKPINTGEEGEGGGGGNGRKVEEEAEEKVLQEQGVAGS